MGLIYAEIELINGDDLALVRNKIISVEDVKRRKVSMLVDSGCYMMGINERIQEELQYPVIDKTPVCLANGEVVECDVVGPVEIRFKNRSATSRAFILPGDAEPLLGAIPMEALDVVIDPKRQEMTVNPKNPDRQMTRA